MTQNYDMMIQKKAERVFNVMEKRVSAQDVERIRCVIRPIPVHFPRGLQGPGKA